MCQIIQFLEEHLENLGFSPHISKIHFKKGSVADQLCIAITHEVHIWPHFSKKAQCATERYFPVTQ